MCDFSSFLGNLTFQELIACRNQLNIYIDAAKKEHKKAAASADVRDYVTEPVTLFKADSVEHAALSVELDSLDVSKSKGAGCVTQWLTLTGQPYSWRTSEGKPVVKNPYSIEDFPQIKETLDLVNAEFEADLNSCLVSYLPDGRSNLRLHNDNEDSLDSSQPMVILTVGASRTVDFLGAYQRSTETPAGSVTPKSGEVYCMKPGCQQLFKHRIYTDKSVRGARYSLSFRRLQVTQIPPPAPFSTNTLSSPSASGVKSFFSQLFTDKSATVAAPVMPGFPTHCDGFQPPGTERNGFQPPPGTDGDGFQPAPGTERDVLRPVLRGIKRTTVLFGTSITESVIGKRLARKGHHVINVSESGADIKMISEMVDDFALYDTAANDVEKVVLCFGTNDIKHSSRGVAHLKTPVFNLINKIKYCFPGATILVMSNLPMKNLYWYTCPNFLKFNDILQDVSLKSNCYYIDCFKNFLSEDRYDYNKFLFRDPWHLNKRGLGILCSILKTAINYNSYGSTFTFNTDFGYYY